MKKLTATLALFYLLTSCSHTMQNAATEIKTYGRPGKPDDATLQKLQQENEAVLIYGIEMYAWVKQKKYYILALNNNEWKGYEYSISFGPNAGSNLAPVNVSQDSCKAVWNFFTDKKVWEIPGDSGANFCEGEKARSCNINDGATWRLMILSKDHIIDPSYYEPKYFEQCCPGNSKRKLFLEAGKKVEEVFGKGEDD